MKLTLTTLFILALSANVWARTNAVENIADIEPKEPGYEQLAVLPSTFSLDQMSSSLSNHRLNSQFQQDEGETPWKAVEGESTSSDSRRQKSKGRSSEK